VSEDVNNKCRASSTLVLPTANTDPECQLTALQTDRHKTLWCQLTQTVFLPALLISADVPSAFPLLPFRTNYLSLSGSSTRWTHLNVI